MLPISRLIPSASSRSPFSLLSLLVERPTTWQDRARGTTRRTSLVHPVNPDRGRGEFIAPSVMDSHDAVRHRRLSRVRSWVVAALRIFENQAQRSRPDSPRCVFAISFEISVIRLYCRKWHSSLFRYFMFKMFSHLHIFHVYVKWLNHKFEIVNLISLKILFKAIKFVWRLLKSEATNWLIFREHKLRRVYHAWDRST